VKNPWLKKLKIDSIPDKEMRGVRVEVFTTEGHGKSRKKNKK